MQGVFAVKHKGKNSRHTYRRSGKQTSAEAYSVPLFAKDAFWWLSKLGEQSFNRYSFHSNQRLFYAGYRPFSIK
jgi:hypothetical protein